MLGRDESFSMPHASVSEQCLESGGFLADQLGPTQQLAIEADSNMHQAWYSIAYAYFEMGRRRDSIDYYLDRALEIDPTFQAALNLRQVLEQSGR